MGTLVWGFASPRSCGRAQHCQGGDAALHMAGSPSSDILFCAESNPVPPSLLCAAATALNLCSPKAHEMRFAHCSMLGGGGKPSRPPFFFNIFYFILFGGEEKEGWHRVGAGDVIKAPAEEICGSGVSTSEKSMAAAAAPQGSVQECGTGSSTSLCPAPAPSCACSLPASHTHLHSLSWIRAAAYFCNQSEICQWHRAPPPASLPFPAVQLEPAASPS